MNELKERCMQGRKEAWDKNREPDKYNLDSKQKLFQQKSC